MREYGEDREEGLSFDTMRDLLLKLYGKHMTKEHVKTLILRLTLDGGAYTTTDEEHYKATA
jgi:hypothetical protein